MAIFAGAQLCELLAVLSLLEPVLLWELEHELLVAEFEATVCRCYAVAKRRGQRCGHAGSSLPGQLRHFVAA